MNRSSLRRWLLLVLRCSAAGLALLLLAAILLVVTLPDTKALVKENPSQTAFMRHWAGRQKDAGKDATLSELRWVPLSRVSRHMQRAVVISEDHEFFLHEGFDWGELRASLAKDLESGKALRGGSTITMQTAKNLYLSPSKNPLRKLREALITVKLERDLSKRRILEIYLNVIEFGDGLYGIENAARRYYGKSAASIDEDEAAWLAACIPNPRHFNPGKVTPGLRKRHALLLDHMRRYRVEGID